MPNLEDYGEDREEVKSCEDKMYEAAKIIGGLVHDVCGQAVAKCLFFPRNAKISCPSRVRCPLMGLRRELEEISPAFYGLIVRGSEAREILEDVTTTELEGDVCQRQESQYRLAVLFQATHCLFSLLLAMRRVAPVPYISPDFIAAMESRPKTCRVSSYSVSAAKLVKFGVNFHAIYYLFGGLPDETRTFIFDLFHIYLCALETETQAGEKIDSSEFYDFDWVENYLHQQKCERQEQSSFSGVH